MSVIELLRQISILLSLPDMVLLGLAAALIVIVRDWRVALFSYAVFSVVLAVLLMQVVPAEWALLQVIVGGLIAVTLFLSARQLRGEVRTGRAGRWPQLASLGIFRLLVVVLALLAFPLVRTWVHPPLLSSTIGGGLTWLAMMGVLGLALHEEPLHAGLSLLVIIGGFQLLLLHLTQSRMIVGLMDGWQLLLGLAIAYLTVSRGLALPAQLDELPTLRWRV